MDDINFDCPQCGQNLDAPDDMVGLFIECPACNKIIKVPSPGGAGVNREQMSPTVRMPPVQASPDEKGSTIPIKLPPNLGVPPTPQRKIIIKRKGP